MDKSSNHFEVYVCVWTEWNVCVCVCVYVYRVK